MSIPLKRKADDVATDRKLYKRRVSSGGVATTSPSWLHSRLVISCPPDLAIDKLRQTMLADMQERVAEVDWDFFMDYLLPPLHKRIRMEDVMEKLAKSKHVVKRNGQLRWAAFADGTPSTQQLPEDKVFEVMEDIASATGLSAKHNGRRSAQIALEPTITPISDTRDNSGKPDGYFMFNHLGSSLKDETPRWCDIAVPAEFKKDENKKSTNSNATQLLWSLNHMMREDARRRFAFGFTIEDAHLRIWFVSRSHILASFAINFTTEMDRVAEFFLRIMWADVRDLGIDETITPTGKKDAAGGVQYDIEVDGKKYRTQRLISSIGAEWIRGRGTRVWVVKELDKEGNEFGPLLVLKDAWVDHGRLREPEILRQVRASARNQQDAEIFERHLLHVAHSGDVLAKSGEPDDTQQIICRGGVPAPKKHLIVKKDIKGDETLKIKNPPKNALATEWAPQKKLVTYPRRVHHRTVFKEVGVTILEAKKLKNAFLVLQDVVTVLRVMHACGWVHRDVSAGNVLIHGDCGKLADLEFAKRATDVQTHDVRTGTEYFMAVEVRHGQYRFSDADYIVAGDDLGISQAESAAGVPPVSDDSPQPKKPRLDFSDSEHEDVEGNDTRSRSSSTDGSNSEKAGSDLGDSEDEDEDGDEAVSAADAAPSITSLIAQDLQPESIVPFRHNPLHDLESVLWLGWYLLVSTKMPQFREGYGWASFMLSRYDLSARLFNDTSFRDEAMLPDNIKLMVEARKLHPIFTSLFQQLNKFRVALVRLYRDTEIAADRNAREWWAAREAARARGEVVSEGDHPPGIPFSVAEDAQLYDVFLKVLERITSDEQSLYIKGRPIVFTRRSTLLAEQLREIEELRELVQAEQEALLAAAASATRRNTGRVPKTPKAPRTLKRKLPQH